MADDPSNCPVCSSGRSQVTADPYKRVCLDCGGEYKATNQAYEETVKGKKK